MRSRHTPVIMRSPHTSTRRACPQLRCGGFSGRGRFANVVRMGFGRLVLMGSMAAVLAACNGADVGASPTALATPTAITDSPTGITSSSVTPSMPQSRSSTTDDVVPAAAKRHNLSGAEALARYYVDRVNAAWSGKAAIPFQNLVATSCKTCRQFDETSTALSTASEHYSTQAMRIGDAIPLPESTVDDAYIQFIYVQQASTIVDAAGQVRRSVPKRSALTQFHLNWHAGSWRIIEINVVKNS